MDPVALFSLFPGWRILVPTTPFDYIGLFNAAMKMKSPIVIVEYHQFYNEKGLIPEGNPDHTIKIGKAIVRNVGSDVTVLSYGSALNLALEASNQLANENISIEVIDLRSLDDASIDYATIGESLKKTGALVTVEEAQRCNSIGHKLVSTCELRWFDFLDGPSSSVNAPDIPLSVSRRMELFCLPSVEQAVSMIRKSARREL